MCFVQSNFSFDINLYYSDKNSLKKTWSTAVLPGIAYNSLCNQIRESGKLLNIEANKIPIDEQSALKVGWDKHAVIPVGKGLITYEVGMCVVVLARATPKDEKNPSHLAMRHAWRESFYVYIMLECLAEIIQKGTIEIFITGGACL